MELKKLDYTHAFGLFQLIKEIYEENPNATWFKSRPSWEMVEALIGYKIVKMKDKEVVDYVALEDGSVVGECEIVKDESGNGWVGIIVKDGFRNQGIGGAMLRKSIKSARRIGVKKIFAEVAQSNSAVEFFKKMGFKARGIENKDRKKIVLLELSS
ncbi:MAG: GNAT family N-acetyltransferase [Candidatus Micrarchaeia archaeon]